MDLRKNQITVNELLREPRARQVLARRFPDLASSPALTMAGGWTVEAVLRFARGRVPEKEVQEALEELRRL